MSTPTSRNDWPPSFTLDQERVLHLLTGDRFYSNPSAALREAVLNAIDAIHRKRRTDPKHPPHVAVTFDRQRNTLEVSDNGVGMNRSDISALFTKVGASAATAEAQKDSVGEFGIGVISYFMASDTFELQTNDGVTSPVGLTFSRSMLAGGSASTVTPTKQHQGTSVTLFIRDPATFELLLDSFKSWCRDVEGMTASLLPDGTSLEQGGTRHSSFALALPSVEWVERAHLGPVADPTGWDSMTGNSTIAVLYRGVFVQEFQVPGVWGIEGSIDVDPKHFKPRLNREGFVGGHFQTEVEAYMRKCHPAVLLAMADRLSHASANGTLDKWTEKRWASLWLSVPRTEPYSEAVAAWDRIFRKLPAFELAIGNKWEAVSLDQVVALGTQVFVAPLADEKFNDVVRAALHFLRNTGQPVIRGLRKDKSWMRYAPASYATTADLISSVFASELPRLLLVAERAEKILADITRSAPLFTGPPAVDLVRLGPESPPALRLRNRLVINTDHSMGAAIAREVLRENRGHLSLIGITAVHAYEQLTEVAAAVREITTDPEILSPVRRRFILSQLP